MNPQLIIAIFSKWQVMAISVFVMVLLPIVFYLASLDRRPVKIRHNYGDLRQAKNKKKPANTGIREEGPEERDKQEENEEDNSKGGKGA
ncbi:MAG: hypothetical protein GXP33_11160 [Spirochaetes bacterium]|nr:hypothetical protein [Spirochaetota bacterium]